MKKLQFSTLKYGAAPLAIGLALLSTPAFAQEADDAEDEGTIVVTGSRIARPNVDAPSPVTVVGSEQIALTGTTSLETLLNELPQVIPGNTRVSNNSGGESFATLDLRGLGPGRTLILLDGERLPASTTTGVVDIAQIPTGLIESVEVVTGGASAVYGSDAMAGVINFKLKKAFEGIQLTGQSSIAENGTGFSMNVSGMVGGNFADGRGNMVVYGSFSDRDSVSQGRFDYSRVSAALYFDGDYPEAGGIAYPVTDPSQVIPDSFLYYGGGSATAPWGSISNNALNPFRNLSTLLPTTFGAGNTDTNCDGVAGGAVNSGTLSFNGAGQLSPYNSGGFCAIPLRNTGSSRYNYAPDNFLVTPQDRLTITALGSYELSDETRVKVYTSYTNASQTVQLAPTPMTGIVVPYNSPLIPADLAIALASRPNPTASFTMARRFSETGPRVGTFTTDAKNIRAVVEHDISDAWSFNVVGSFGRVDNLNKAQGNIRRSAVVQGLNNCPTGSAPGCVPINIFGQNTLTPAMLSFVALDTKVSEQFEQARVASTVTGSLMELPGGPIGVAVGVEWRKDTGLQIVDDAQRTGDIVGFNAVQNIAGSISVKEVYGEIRLPILDIFSVGAGARYSDYSTVGGLFNWKAEAEFTPTDWVKVRASYNKAARAPNVFELFQNGDQGFPSYGDPCNARTNSLTGVLEPTPYAAQCIAQGVPAALIPTFAQTNSQVEAFAFGQPDLQEEKGTTWTAGIVLQPSNVLGGRMTLTADYYNIKITNRISALGVSSYLSNCYVSGIASDCARIVRDPATGQIDSINTGRFNSSVPLVASGVDVGLDWRIPVGDGSVYIQDTLSWTEKYKIGSINYAGTVFSGIGGVTPKWSNTLTVGYQSDSWTFQVRHVWDQGGRQGFDGSECQAYGDCTLIDPTPDDDDDSTVPAAAFRIPDFSVINASLRFNVTDNFELTAIVNNLFNKYPKPTYTGFFEQANTNINFYDGYALGRNYTLQARVKF